VQESVVATVEDIDTAVSSGPGLRWAAMGPTPLFHLGAGDGGLAAFCERYSGSFNRWWDDRGQPHLDAATTRKLVDGLDATADTRTIDDLARHRDTVLSAVVAATHRRSGNPTLNTPGQLTDGDDRPRRFLP
jgi:3-hydroxybutyryl-CoA dehydrogenase